MSRGRSGHACAQKLSWLAIEPYQGNTIIIAQRSMSAFMAVYIRDDSSSPYFADWHKHYNQNNR
ncbi:hypothetical protein NS303_12210 [Pantoea ananatis]|nr:hypothetical protein C1N63_15350 [Pantoea ananatis]KTR48141.1 hypothetical protein NS303_12210 [Pantoea ananatis]KTR54371.1 hypothetical protein NS311_16550 [Pantoea ananatis]KTR67092.1 hypothetical protein RSA47_01105 [Pantoea ananatis]KTR72032.1 hypothetical protein NS296_05180 [Pantoea ananatis]